MPLKKNKISYTYDLSKELKGLNRRQKSEAKRLIADFLLSEIESSTLSEISPVTGEQFPSLEPEYAAVKRKLGKGTRANLHLKDEMINAIKTQIIENGVVLKITDSLQKKKAHGHNTGMKDNPKIKKKKRRAFIPDDEISGKYGTFSPSIRSAVKDLIRSVKDDSS